MRKLFTLTIIFIAAQVCSHAQQYSLHEYVLMQNTATLGTTLKTFDNQYADIKGEAFLSPDWQNGAAISVNNKLYTGLKIKVDLYKNKIFLNISDTVFDFTDANNISSFIIYPNAGDTTKKLIFSTQFKVPGVNSKLLQVIGTGSLVTLLKDVTKDVQDSQGGLYSAKEQRFMDHMHYYLQKDGSFTDIKLSKKTLEKIFSAADASKIADYVKQQKLSLSDEEGWAAALDFYNNKMQ